MDSYTTILAPKQNGAKMVLSDELERIWMDAIVAQSKYFSGVYLNDTRKTTKSSVKIVSPPVET